MKRCQLFFATLCGLAVLFAASANAAAVPQTINYQGRLADAVGDPVPNVPILVKFTIWDAAAAGAMLWNSGFQSVTPEDGLFTYPLGSMVNLPDNLFTDTIRYLGITVGADPELVPRERFRTVPYAYHALRADTADISVTVFDNSITAAKLAANSVGLSEMQNNAIGSAEVIDNSLTANDLASNSVGLSEMQSSSIGSAEVIDNSLTANDLAAGSVGTSEVADNTLTFNDLAAGSVGASELSTGSVVGGVGGDILDNTIHSADILNSTITGADIATGTITSSDISNFTITGADIANNAITSSKVANGSLLDVDIVDEPGVAQARTATSISLTGPVQVLLSRTLTAPTSGFVLAVATCEASIFHNSGTFSSADFGVSISSTTFPFAGSRRWAISNLLGNGTREVVITVTRMFSVGSGATTFYFLGDKAGGANNHNVDDMSLSLAFFPTAYGTFSTEPTSPPGNSDEKERLHETLDGRSVKPLDK